MTIRTITGLPDVNVSSDNIAGSFMEMSVPIPGSDHYSSRRIKYEVMRDDSCSYATSKIVNDYGLSSSAGTVNAASIQESVNAVMSADCTLSGIKQFDEWPCVKAEFPDASSLSSSTYGDDG